MIGYIFIVIYDFFRKYYASGKYSNLGYRVLAILTVVLSMNAVSILNLFGIPILQKMGASLLVFLVLFYLASIAVYHSEGEKLYADWLRESQPKRSEIQRRVGYYLVFSLMAFLCSSIFVS